LSHFAIVEWVSNPDFMPWHSNIGVRNPANKDTLLEDISTIESQ